jgi:hypothetical protein
MTRRLASVLAVAFGGAAAVLVASGVGASHDGRRVDCTTVINAAAVDTLLPSQGEQRG